MNINNNHNKNYYPDEKSGVCVVKRKGETDEDLLKRFRKKFSKSGIAKEVRDRMYYEKPSAKKRRKKMQSVRLVEKEEQKRFQADELLDQNKGYNVNKNRKDSQNDSSSHR